MKLTNELQNKIGNAKSEDEVKKILGETKKNVEDAGVILDDEELDQASGGLSCKRGDSTLADREVHFGIYKRIPLG